MPRAHRIFLPGLIWHLTHRCHQREFLLQFARDRRLYLRWLFEARKRYGLCILNYMITSNHVHLLVEDTGAQSIAESLQLVAGRTAQEFNRRKNRHGAFWEDRYHATAIDRDSHLHRCLVYMDLNMVRAGVVDHPEDWKTCGYREIQMPPKRYAIIDATSLATLCGFSNVEAFRAAHRSWIAAGLGNRSIVRESDWSDAVAVGRRPFVVAVQDKLGIDGRYRSIGQAEGRWTLREPTRPYAAIFSGKNAALSAI